WQGPQRSASALSWYTMLPCAARPYKCTGGQPMTGAPGSQAARRFTKLADEYLKSSFEFMPPSGSRLGLHEYDGRTPDLSQGAIDRWIVQVRQALDELAAIDAGDLDPDMRLDYDLLRQGISSELFRFAEQRE